MKKECEACGAMEPVLARGIITNRWLCESCHAAEYQQHEKEAIADYKRERDVSSKARANLDKGLCSRGFSFDDVVRKDDVCGDCAYDACPVHPDQEDD